MSLKVLCAAVVALLLLLSAARRKRLLATPPPALLAGEATVLLLRGPCRPGFVAAARERAAWPHTLQILASEDCAAVPGVRGARGRLPRTGTAVLAHGALTDLAPHWDKKARAAAAGRVGTLFSHGLQPRQDVTSRLEALPLWRAAYPDGTEEDCPDYRLLFGASAALDRVAAAWFDSPWAAPALAWACRASGLELARAPRAVAAASKPLALGPMTAADGSTLRARLVSVAALGAAPPLCAGEPMAFFLKPALGAERS